MAQASTPSKNPLGLTMQVQAMSKWCWAATSSSIHDFYFGGPDPDYTQEKLVGKAFGGSCVASPYSNACNRPATLRKGLDLTQHYQATLSGKLSLANIQSCIDQFQPIAVGIVGTQSNIGHVLAIIGYDQSAYIIVKDPAIGDAPRVVALAAFPANLYADYRWHESCTTQA